ncbi:putative nuclease HARBI1 [Hypomesus transpacificus]|uniref:putative nuclease HARBI1 n=1 Tax=Hypomesus transpacificus TaxID=137520 RepID=UPI001F07302D|nr:putative nuclease HARBI1 [Hypomesus transpacificus]
MSPLDILEDSAIQHKYRLRRADIMMLLNLVEADLQRPTQRSYALTPATQLLAALRFYATGSFLEVLGDGYGLSKASVSRSVQAVTSALLRHIPDHIQFPTTRGDKSAVQDFLWGKHNIPQVIGVIDGTLIPILTPSNDGHVFFCRKGFAAINCQVICDHRGLITDLVARWPGSSHDSYVFSNSSVGQEAQASRDGWLLLGDSGYPLRPYLLTPVANPHNEAEERYNEAHRVARSIVERTLGTWKMRFRCLRKSAGGLLFHPTKCCAVIAVTAMLHNLAVRAGTPLGPQEDQLEEDGEEEDGPPLQAHDPRHVQYLADFEARQRVINEFFV